MRLSERELARNELRAAERAAVEYAALRDAAAKLRDATYVLGDTLRAVHDPAVRRLVIKSCGMTDEDYDGIIHARLYGLVYLKGYQKSES